MGLLLSFIAVNIIAIIGFYAGPLSPYTFGVIIPYIAAATFIIGMLLRIIRWGRTPIPFRIPTTCGQQKSLKWIKQNKLENPSSSLGVIGRMFLEVFFFRSLFRNLKTEKTEDNRVTYGSDKWLWLFGLAFHYAFFFVLIRHLRFFLEPVPGFIHLMEGVDSFFQIGVPLLYMTDVVFLVSVTFLFLRRVYLPYVRYISLLSDYFPLFLIFGIGLSGVLMRYFMKTDVVGVKNLTMGLVTFSPTVPSTLEPILFTHLFLISILFAYFPFSKLVHMAGVFMSPTRNMINNSRMKRHVNPWSYDVKVHTYEEYEEHFRKGLKSAGIPVEKE